MRDTSLDLPSDHELVSLLEALYQVGVRTVSAQELRASLLVTQPELQPALDKLCVSEHLARLHDGPTDDARYYILARCGTPGMPIKAGEHVE